MLTARNAGANWAIGEIRITTAGVWLAGVWGAGVWPSGIPASSHWSVASGARAKFDV